MSLSVPARSLLVCSTQRSGSTYLCRLLAATGVAGDPQEYFEAMAETGRPPHPGFFLAGLPRTGAGIRDDLVPPDVPDYSDVRAVADWREHLERTYRLGTTANGVFSTKLMWNQLPEIEWYAASVPELAGLRGLRLIERLFGECRWVWVRRRDRVQQAISLWRALQTRTWRSENPSGRPGTDGLQYSFTAIEHLCRRLSSDDQAWSEFFAATGADVMEIGYEDDVEPDPDRAVARVLAHLGVDPPAGWSPQTSMVRQSDELSAAWRAAYDRDAAARQSP